MIYMNCFPYTSKQIVLNLSAEVTTTMPSVCVRVIQSLLCWLLFVITTPICVIPLILLYCYRFLVTVILRRLLRKDLFKVVKNADYLFTSDDFLKRPIGANVMMGLIDGEIDLNQVYARAIENVNLHGKPTKSGQTYNYERMISIYPINWLGFAFWKKMDPGTFNLHDHIKLISVSSDSNEKVDTNSIVTNWMMSPFAPQRPLWEMLIISGIKGEDGKMKTIIGARSHHMIGDGISFVQFVQSLADKSEMTAVNYPTMNSSGILTKLKMLYWAPLALINHLSNAIFHSDYFSYRKTSFELVFVKASYPVSDLRTIRKNWSVKLGFNVPFLTIYVCALGGAIKKLIKTDLGDCENKRKMLNHLTIVVATPSEKPHQEGKICNNWNHGVIELPIDGNNVDRLNHILQNVGWMAYIGAFRINQISSKLVSLLTRNMISAGLNFVYGTTIGMATLRGPEKCNYVFGNPVVEQYIIIAPQSPHASFTIGCYSYNGELNLAILANQSVLSKENIEKLLHHYMREELESLLLETASDTMV